MIQKCFTGVTKMHMSTFLEEYGIKWVNSFNYPVPFINQIQYNGHKHQFLSDNLMTKSNIS